MDREELLTLLIDAQDLLAEAVESLRYYVKETGDANAQAYLVEPLAARINGRGTAGSITIQDLMERVEANTEPPEIEHSDVTYTGYGQNTHAPSFN